MFLIVGLGNPGAKYENTPHNAGFAALAEFEKKGVEGVSVQLLKPQSFMNRSGFEVKDALRNFKLTNEQLVVIHDDIDLPLGKVKVSKDSGAGGHKGVISIIEQLGTKDFVRIRIGIQPITGKPENVEDFVLKRFSKEDSEIFSQAIKASCSALETFLTKGLGASMNEFNK